MNSSEELVVVTLTETKSASRELRLELSLNTSLVEAAKALIRIKLTPATCDWALTRAIFALDSAEFTLVTAKLARFKLEITLISLPSYQISRFLLEWGKALIIKLHHYYLTDNKYLLIKQRISKYLKVYFLILFLTLRIFINPTSFISSKFLFNYSL